MSRRTETIAPDYFDALYKADPDPWRFRTSAYEQRKYSDTLAQLKAPRYASGLEVGCAIGVFTQLLASRCDALEAVDASLIALAQAKAHCRDLPHVGIGQAIIPDDFPSGPFDLVVLSEVLYYLTVGDVLRTAARCRLAVREGGEVVLCHWLGETDYPLSGDEAPGAFTAELAALGWRHEVTRRDLYRLDHLTAPR